MSLKLFKLLRQLLQPGLLLLEFCISISLDRLNLLLLLKSGAGRIRSARSLSNFKLMLQI